MKKPYPITDKVIESRQRTARLYNTKKVKMYDLHTGEFLNQYDSIQDAEIDNDLPYGAIYQAFCRGNGELKKAGLKFVRIERGSK